MRATTAGQGQSAKRRARRGVTLVELMVSVGILGLLGALGMVMMVFYARSFAGLHAQSRIQHSVTLAMQRLNLEMDEAVRVTIGEHGDRLRIVYAQGNLRRELVYIDGDDDPETISDNRLVLREFIGGEMTSEQVLLRGVSPVGETPVFNRLSVTGRDVWEVALRVGDRDRPPSPENQSFTGPGFQTHVARFVLTPRNALTGG